MTVKELMLWLNEHADSDMNVRVYDGSYMNDHDIADTPEIITAENGYSGVPVGETYVFIGPAL